MARNLERYFSRIGYQGSKDVTVDTLFSLHRQQSMNIPYENLDVYLGRPVDLDLDRIFDKIVDQGRGGWCYELNGLFGWALGEMGFDVTRLCGGVHREFSGDEALGNHLVLHVALEGSWIADVGLGGGMLEPLRLQEGEIVQAPGAFRLQYLGEDIWRFHNSEGAIPVSFDFIYAKADEALLADRCHDLQTNPDSLFVNNLICHLFSKEGRKSLTGRVLQLPLGKDKETLHSQDQLAQTLTEDFGISLPEIDGLWDKVVARHTQLFGDEA